MNKDLFTALKGSQNNLGIITRFDILAFKQGDIWGGTTIYNASTVPQQLEAFVKFTDNIENDPYGSLIFVWDYIPANNSLFLLNLYEYTREFADNATNFPPAFHDFSNRSAIGPPNSNTLRIANLSSLTGELNSQANLRWAGTSDPLIGTPAYQVNSNLYATLTFTNNLTVLQRFVEILNDELDFYKKSPFYTYASVEFQPLPRIITDHSTERGGNVLGLDRYHDNNISMFPSTHTHPARALIDNT